MTIKSENCKHEDRIFGICITCKHDNGAIDNLNKRRTEILGNFKQIGQDIKKLTS